MKPGEMREDIPMDVREALAAWLEKCRVGHDSDSLDSTSRLRHAIRAKPKTVRMPAADIPAPLTEVPESGWVCIVDPVSEAGVLTVTGGDALRAVGNKLAWGTTGDALAALAAFTAREDEE